ncbi:MAG TPA: MFS transporter [Stellaceae bacterium]|nr:MFS transporter [Stellaceae bacterium]
MTALQEPPPIRARLSAEALAAGAVGNLLEWYDFGLYGLFAPVLAPLFFPSADPLASLIGAYGGFALGFAVRPLGGAVLGHLGDRIGRGFVLIASVVLMGAATSAMALLPSYHRIGIAAPILLLLVRILQGFSVGGEFTGSVCYLVETAPPGRRGLAGSFANIGSTSGVLLAAGIAAATVTLAGDTPAREWAWRLPFLFGGVLALLAYLVRRRLIHSGPTPKIPASKDQPPPLRQALRQSPRAMVYAVLFTSGYGVVNYLTMVFLPTFASQFGGIAESTALRANTAAQAVALCVVPLAGWATDRWLRRRTMLMIAFIAETAVAWAAFALIRHDGAAALWPAQILFGALLALVMGTAPAMLSELFRRDYRLSGYSVSFNIGIGIAGGTAPLIATALILVTGNPLAPAWYLMAAGALAAGAAFLMTDRSRQPLQ